MTKETDDDRASQAGPHPTDRHVGVRIRLRRKELGVSQERLAESVGLTFQQVQKYESGTNRVSASRLWELAQALKVPVGWFFEGLEAAEEAPAPVSWATQAQAFLLSREGLEMAAAFPRLPPNLRRRLLDLVRSLAEAESEDAAA